MQTALVFPPVPLPTLLLPALRERTHALHERLERRLNITARLSSPALYRTLLERFYGWYAPLEERLAAPEYAAVWTTLEIIFERRRKAGLLESDLRVLGVTTADMAGLERCPDALLAIPSSAADLVGCAYVMEGATLGGQVIGRLLEPMLGLRPGEPCARFFHGYGSRTGAMWQQFRRVAEEFAAREDAACPEGSPENERSVVSQAAAAACRTFASMEAWLIPEGEVFHE